MPGFAKLLNTSEVSVRDSLQGLYKDFLTYENPLRFQVKAVITLPNEDHISISLKRTELYPDDTTPLVLLVRLS
jgi:hypothetical protein